MSKLNASDDDKKMDPEGIRGRRSAADDPTEDTEGHGRRMSAQDPQILPDDFARRAATEDPAEDTEGHIFTGMDTNTSRHLAKSRSADIEREMRERQRQKEARPNRR